LNPIRPALPQGKNRSNRHMRLGADVAVSYICKSKTFTTSTSKGVLSVKKHVVPGIQNQLFYVALQFGWWLGKSARSNGPTPRRYRAVRSGTAPLVLVGIFGSF
jgi:hypothetical protein